MRGGDEPTERSGRFASFHQERALHPKAIQVVGCVGSNKRADVNAETCHPHERPAASMRLASLLSAVVAAVAATVPDTEAAELAAENSMLQLKLKQLEDELQQEIKHSSVLTRASRTLHTVRTGYAC